MKSNADPQVVAVANLRKFRFEVFIHQSEKNVMKEMLCKKNRPLTCKD